MEITLEKIELVKDRTGVSYKEAKDALEAAEGSVVDAIIAIEESIDEEQTGKVNSAASQTMEKIKNLVKKGNISKVTVKKDDETIVNIPVNVGILGAVIAPWGVIAAAVAAYGLKCKVELTTDEGKVIDVTAKADEAVNTVKEKSSVVVDGIKEKAPNGDAAKEKAAGVWETVKEKSTETFQTVKEAAQGKISEFKNRDAEDEDICSELQKAVDDICEAGEGVCDEVCEAVEEACEDIAEACDEAAEAIVEDVKIEE